MAQDQLPDGTPRAGIAAVGGCGSHALDDAGEVAVDTPWGPPSARVPAPPAGPESCACAHASDGPALPFPLP